MRHPRHWLPRVVWPALALAPLVAALLVSGSFSQAREVSARVKTPAFPLTQGHWKLELNSVFTGGVLNSPWSSSRFGNGQVAAGFNSQELECFDPSRVTVASASMTLRVVRKRQRCDGRWRPYSSGIASTVGRWSFKYGLLEARIWVPRRGRQIADWPAVWLGGKAEIDVFEGGGIPAWFYHVRNRRWGGGVNGVHFTNGWHTVAVDWEPHSISWYYDRHRVGRLSSRAAPITSAPMSVVLDLAVSARMPQTRAVPATFQIGWVKVWQPVK